MNKIFFALLTALFLIFILLVIKHLKHCPNLKLLWIEENPFCETNSNYREEIINELPQLVKLDKCVGPDDEEHYLTKEAKEAYDKMCDAITNDGLHLGVTSSYRSYKDQVDTYNYYLYNNGQNYVDKYVAVPGYSEHQSGLAADINTAASWFDDTAEAKWLKENCYKYGFIVRFPKGEEEYTGYKYESWHLRYVGKNIAKKIHEAGDISLEHYYGLTSKYKD